MIKVIFGKKFLIFSILSLCVLSCSSTSKMNGLEQKTEFNDVLILSFLIRDRLLKTDDSNFTLNDIIQNDSLERISSNFKMIEINRKRGYIAVNFEFSETRKTTDVLSNEEKELIEKVKWEKRDLKSSIDGVIHLDYGEDWYRIKEIIINHN